MKKIFLLLIVGFQLQCTQNVVENNPYQMNLGWINSTNAQADLDSLIIHLEKVHYNPYLNIAKKRFINHINNQKNNWGASDSIPKAQFIINMMQIMSLMDDGHSNMVWYDTAILPNRDSIGYMPLSVSVNPSGQLYLSEHDQYKGQIINTINGKDALKLYNDALRCLAGNPIYKQEINQSLFFPVFLYLNNIEAPFSIELNDGQYIEDLKGIDFIQLYMRLQPQKKHYELKILDNEIAIIHYNSCTDYEAFKLFLEGSFKTIKEENIKDLIIDISHNSGGDSSLNDLLIPYFTNKKYRQSSKRLWKISDISIEELNNRGFKEKYGDNYIEQFRVGDSNILDFDEEDDYTHEKPQYFFNGNTYVLIGHKTYSSANMLADAVSTYDLATLIGAATGEKTNDFGEQKTALLPHSQLPYNYTIAYDIGADGNERSDKVVQPDIIANMNYIDFTINYINKKSR